MWAQSPADIGKIIATARKHLKLSQAALAKLLGTTQAWISEVEQGKETAQIGLVLRALRRLGVRLRTANAPWEIPMGAPRAGSEVIPHTPSLADILAKTSENPRARRAPRSKGSR